MHLLITEREWLRLTLPVALFNLFLRLDKVGHRFGMAAMNFPFAACPYSSYKK
jgi:hypothetical protein